jgi:hypothetical protein
MPLMTGSKSFGPQRRVGFEFERAAILRTGCPSIPQAVKIQTRLKGLILDTRNTAFLDPLLTATRTGRTNKSVAITALCIDDRDVNG